MGLEPNEGRGGADGATVVESRHHDGLGGLGDGDGGGGGGGGAGIEGGGGGGSGGGGGGGGGRHFWGREGEEVL